MNGATIVIITQWNALCYLYTINICFSKKDRKNLFQHQNQLCQWITIIERVRKMRPATINVSWKSKRERVINLAFGASITALNWENRKELCKIRQKNDKNLLPRDQHGNVPPKLDVWPFGNCSEMNAWTYLCQWRPDLQINSRTMTVHEREIMDPCENCKAIQNWLTD